MKSAKSESKPAFRILLFSFVMVILLLPGLQGMVGFPNEKPLSGAFTESAKPDFGEFTWKSWLDGSFQEEYNNRLEQNIGFRNSLVRLNNQISFSLYRQANAEGVIVGQKNELFEEDYIREYTGQYFVGEKVWQKKARQLRAVQDTLSKLGKSLVIIFEPGKGSFYADRLPGKYRNIPKTVSNYDVLNRELISQGVNVLDLNSYFLSIKEKSKYPLFPQCGTHWSYYGSVLAADTTLKYLEKLRGSDLPDISIVSNETGDTIRHPDYDIGLAMNLIFMIKHPLTTDPKIKIDRSSGKTRPQVLIAGDSFYFNWLNNHIPTEAFSSCDFWYYNNNITKNDGSSGGKASEKDFRSEVMRNDIIAIMITERFMHAFAWGFDEQLYDLFFPGYRDPEEVFADQIRSYGDEFGRMVKEAIAMNISLEERINKEANYLFYDDYKANPDKYTEKRDLLRIYEMGIRGTPDWMQEMVKKAAINKISVDEQIRRDAEWIYEDKMKNK